MKLQGLTTLQPIKNKVRREKKLRLCLSTNRKQLAVQEIFCVRKATNTTQWSFFRRKLIIVCGSLVLNNPFR